MKKISSFPFFLGVFFLVFLGTYFFLTASPRNDYPTQRPSPIISVTPQPENKNTSPLEAIHLQAPETSALLPGATWVPQTFNNCGPATTAMVLQYFGFHVSQNETKAKLRTNTDDKNVFSSEIVTYLDVEYGVKSKLLYGGSVDRIKLLLANGFYVIVEDWLHPNEDIGHVTIIRGFDDNRGVFIFDDSFIGINTTIPYGTFDQSQWKPFNREYIPLYREEQEALLRQIIGEDWDEQTMYTHAMDVAKKEIAINDQDLYAWFNLGSSLFGLSRYKEAKVAYEQAAAIGWPKRMLWYQIQPIQVYNQLGEYTKALDLIQQGLAGNDSFAELHHEAARAYKGLGETQQATREAQAALRYDPGFSAAKELLQSLD